MFRQFPGSSQNFRKVLLPNITLLKYTTFICNLLNSFNYKHLSFCQAVVLVECTELIPSVGVSPPSEGGREGGVIVSPLFAKCVCSQRSHMRGTGGRITHSAPWVCNDPAVLPLSFSLSGQGYICRTKYMYMAKLMKCQGFRTGVLNIP